MCDADDCEKPKHGLKPYCRMHLARLARTGTLQGIKATQNLSKTCTADDCNEPYTRKDSQLCEVHFAERKAKIDIERTARLRLYDELMNPKTADEIDYNDMWQWIKKEMAA